jgi:hypothetical protein
LRPELVSRERSGGWISRDFKETGFVLGAFVVRAADGDEVVECVCAAGLERRDIDKTAGVVHASCTFAASTSMAR